MNAHASTSDSYKDDHRRELVDDIITIVEIKIIDVITTIGIITNCSAGDKGNNHNNEHNSVKYPYDCNNRDFNDPSLNSYQIRNDNEYSNYCQNKQYYDNQISRNKEKIKTNILMH